MSTKGVASFLIAPALLTACASVHDSLGVKEAVRAPAGVVHYLSQREMRQIPQDYHEYSGDWILCTSPPRDGQERLQQIQMSGRGIRVLYPYQSLREYTCTSSELRTVKVSITCGSATIFRGSAKFTTFEIGPNDPEYFQNGPNGTVVNTPALRRAAAGVCSRMGMAFYTDSRLTFNGSQF